MKTLHLNIVSPESTLFDGQVEAVTLPGTMGRFTILPQHAPIVSSLRVGEVGYIREGRTEFIRITGGFVEMSNGNVSVCVEQNS
ncbi:MAG: ATP synthase F1 subunit epsilon [Bacteroides sp.]|nr:ATP synthase F1 subunit epsilon [Bacteroides sp.]MBQ8224514.1 ATP synthase F1 subunit epsilon [Bacteroides sp.]